MEGATDILKFEENIEFKSDNFYSILLARSFDLKLQFWSIFFTVEVKMLENKKSFFLFISMKFFLILPL